MPRVLTRPVLREIQKEVLVPIEILDVSVEPPYEVFGYQFVNNTKSINFAGKLYAPLGWTRGPAETEAAEGVDRVTITLDDVEKYWERVGQRTVLQGSRLLLRKVFIGLLDNPKNAIPVFDGYAGAPTYDDTTFAIEVRSPVAYNETELPSRTFEPGCPYYLGEGRCGVDMTIAPNRLEIWGGPGSSKFRLKAEGLSGYQFGHFNAGYGVVVEGINKGIPRPIDTSKPGEVTFLLPFDHSLEGQKVRVVRGCRKTKADCDTRYNNLPNYGGFAETPVTPILDA